MFGEQKKVQSTVAMGKRYMACTMPVEGWQGQITEYLVAMTRHVSTSREETGFVLLTAGPLTPRAVPVIIDSQETGLENAYSE